MMFLHQWTQTLCALCLAHGLAACSVSVESFGFLNGRAWSARISTDEAVLGPDGRCEADASLDPSTLRGRPAMIAPGMSECDLVRVKNTVPDEVIIGRDPAGQRLTTVIYGHGSNRKIYSFFNNRLKG